MSSGAPWWAFIVTAGVASISICVSVFSLWYNIKKTDEREMEKWKRDAIVKTTSEFISASGRRHEYITFNFDKWDIEHSQAVIAQFSELRRLVYQFAIIDNEDIVTAADRVMKIHRKAAIFGVSNSTETEIVDFLELDIEHRKLIVLATKLTSRKYKPKR